MAQKRASKSGKGRRKINRQKSRKFNVGKFTLGMLILLVLGYAALSIWEGKLIPDQFSDFELPDFELDEAIDEWTEEEDPEASQEGLREPADKSEEVEEPFDADAFDLYFTKAFDFGWPAYTTEDAVIERPYYTISYNESHEQANWAAYKLWADSLKQEKHERKDNFRKDPRVRTGSAQLNDYRGSGYDRGHLAPAAAFSYDEFALSQSFYMSNMSPQTPAFNRGIWKKLEAQVREWALTNEEIYVITGPVLSEGLASIGKNEVSVPDYYYKIILDIQLPEIKAIAFLMKNEGSTKALSSFIVPIDSIESLTQLDFFPTMPEDLEAYLESGQSSENWSF